MSFPGILLGVGVIAVVNWLFEDGEKKVFFSYHAVGDARYKNLISAWSVNRRFDIHFEDVSTDVSIQSQDGRYIRRKVKERIEECDVFVVLIGEDTHKRPWVEWEIDIAKELGKPIVAIKEDRTFRSPRNLLSSNVRWVYRFSERKIREAIEAVL